MKIINLTPHSVTLCGEDGSITIEPSGVVARVATTQCTIGDYNGVPIVIETIGQVSNLPDEAQNVCYIVSRLVAQAECLRRDLYFPTNLLRDSQGRITGAGALGQI